MCVSSSPPSYVLALDQGTTSSRALLFGKDGRVAFTKNYEFDQHYPHPGWCEHHPEDILESTVKCVSEVVAMVPHGSIGAIGITNQRETLVAWDRETGKPLCNAIVWLDLRTAETVKKLVADGGQDRFRAVTGLPVSTYFTAVKMRWMLDNVEAVRLAADEKRCMFGTVDSWLVYKLTGGANGGLHVTDVTNASRYMLMDLATCEWSQEVCDAVGIPMHTLPTIVSSSEMIGNVCCESYPSLCGVPITAMIGDQQSALLGHGCLRVGQAKNTYGTGCFMLTNTGTTPVQSTAGLLTTVAFRLGKDEPTIYALEGSVACAGRAVQWLRDQLEVIESAPEVERLANSVPHTGGVTVVPAFSGLFAPHWRPDARAIITGMTLGTTKAHICRAVLEAVALQTVEVCEAMERDSGMPVEKMYTDGGMTANALLMQMQADFLNREVFPAAMAESTAFGAGYAAGLAINFWDVPLKVLIANLGGHRTVEPHPAAEQRRLAVRRRWDDAVRRTLNLEEFCEVADE